MDTLFEITDEKKIRIEFLKSSNVNNGRGIALTSHLAGSERKEVQLSMDGRSAVLTLWGKETDLEVVAWDMNIVRNIVPGIDFNRQRFNLPTKLTKFEINAYTVSSQACLMFKKLQNSNCNAFFARSNINMVIQRINYENSILLIRLY